MFFFSTSKQEKVAGSVGIWNCDVIFFRLWVPNKTAAADASHLLKSTNTFCAYEWIIESSFLLVLENCVIKECQKNLSLKTCSVQQDLFFFFSSFFLPPSPTPLCFRLPKMSQCISKADALNNNPALSCASESIGCIWLTAQLFAQNGLFLPYNGAYL